MKVMTIANAKTIESREVAEMVGMRHDHLMRNIDNYIDVISQNPKLGIDQYFIKSTYTAGTGKAYKCYKLTKMGCEMVANKLTGDKGILFTAAYVKRFNDMERKNKPLTELDTTKQMRAEAMLNNSQARKAKLLYEIAKGTENELYKQAGEAYALNMLAGSEVVPMPEAEQRLNHELGYFCKYIGKPKTWKTVLGKKLKEAGVQKTAESGVYKVMWDNGNNQRDTFFWFDDVLLPKLEELFPNEYNAM